MANLVFPYKLAPDSVSGVEPPNYGVRVFTSDEGIETRTVFSSMGYESRIVLSYSSAKPAVAAQVLDFYRLCRGEFHSFTIPTTHKMWSFVSYVDMYMDILETDFWRFEEKPNIQTDLKNIHDIEIKLLSVYA